MPRGRPQKLTPAKRAVILDAIRAGLTQQRAAESVGVHTRSVGRWKDADPSFADACVQAEAQFEQSMLAIVVAAAPRSWQAAGWTLERRFPQRYALVERARLEVQQEYQNVADTLGLDASALIAEAERIAGEA